MFSRTYTPGLENSARFRSPRATPFSLDQSTSERNCRSCFTNSPASNICEGTIPRDSANAPLTTLARSTPCILFARETDERNVNSFESWLVESGYEIAWDLVTQDEMFAASVASFHGGSNE